MTSWFAIALDEIKTRGILREEVDCKQRSPHPGAFAAFPKENDKSPGGGRSLLRFVCLFVFNFLRYIFSFPY